MGKLTEARRTFLVDVSRNGVTRYPSDKMAKWARLEGYVEWDGPAGSGKWWVLITKAGLAALSPTPHEDGGTDGR